MGAVRHKRYRTTRPTMLPVTEFGTIVANSTPDLVFTNILTVELFISMVDWTPAGSTHQLAHMDALDNQDWIFSIHPDSSMRFAMYPTGLNASLVGLASPITLASALGGEAALTSLKVVGVRALIALVFFAQRIIQYQYTVGFSNKWTNLGDPQIEAAGGFLNFFNPNCGLQCPGLLVSGLKNYYLARVYNSNIPSASNIVAELDFTKRNRIKGVPAGTWSDRFGNSYALGAFNAIGRSNSPAPYAA